MLDRVADGEADYHFIEFMGCLGGCITGGGQPIVDPMASEWCSLWEQRAKSIYNVDKFLPVRRSHENPFVKQLYSEIGEPGGEKAHHLLHTGYTARELYPAHN
jgi:NADP-reducing hydrogenase subunit HndD